MRRRNFGCYRGTERDCRTKIRLANFPTFCRQVGRFNLVKGGNWNSGLQIQASAIKNYKNGKGTLCPEDLELLTNWELDTNMTESIAEFLTLAGWNELQDIATRYQRAYPGLLPSTYSSSLYIFRHSDTQRTLASFRAFADGLFGYNGHNQVVPEPIPQRDLLLRVIN